VVTYFGIETVVRHLLVDNHEIDERDASYNFTPLEEALYRGHFALAETLLSAGATATASCLRLAIYGEFLELVCHFLDEGVDPNDTGGDGYSALEQSVILRRYAITEELLRRGISLPSRTQRETTIWRNLGHRWDTKMWHILRKYLPEGVASKGIYVSAITATEIPNLKGLKEMVENGFELVPGKTDSGLISRAIEVVKDKGDDSVLDYLLSKGVRVTASNIFAALEGATKYNKLGRILERLLISESDVPDNDDDDYSGLLDPLKSAIRSGNAWAVELLLDKTGRSLEDSDQAGDHLQSAAREGHTDLVRLMLERGVAPYDAEFPDFTNALVEAIENSRTDLVSTLLPYYQKDDEPAREARKAALEAATKVGSVDNIEAILQLEKDTKQRVALASSALVSAAEGGSLETLTHLISRGADVNEFNDYGNLPLAQATSNNSLETMRVLLRNKADPNKRLNRGSTSLHIAAREGRLEAAKLLLTNRARLNAIDSDGMTPLSEAVSSGRHDLVQLLLGKGAAAAIRDQWGDTAAARATKRGDTEIAKLLNEASEAYEQGGTEIHRIVVKVKAPRAIALLESYKCLDRENWYGESALYRAAEKGRTTIVEYLLFRGAKVDCKTWSGQTPLMRAAEVGMADVVRLLLQWDADVNLQDRYGMTALHRASFHGYRSIVQNLLAHGADSTLQTHKKHTASHLAAMAGHLKTLKVLLSKSLASLQGGTEGSCLELAIQEGQASVVEFLLTRQDAGCDAVCGAGEEKNTLLEKAVRNGQVAIMEALLKKGADPNMPTGSLSAMNETSLIIYTVRNYQDHPSKVVCDMLRLLLRFGADVNSETNSNDTALTVAVCEGNTEAVAILLSAGADFVKSPNNRSVWNDSLLVTAAKSGNCTIVRQLLNAGAVVDPVGDDGDDDDRALGVAVEEGHVEVVQLLLEAGANVNARHGWAQGTILEEAATKGHSEIVRLLLRAGADVDIKPGWANKAEISDALEKSNTGKTRRLIQQAQIDRERDSNTLRQRLWDMDNPELHLVLMECGVQRFSDIDDIDED
jgi:ankyrin repeat protein